MEKIKLSIGIPAYNEEANIGLLLTKLLSQRQDSYTIEEIIIVSDGSTDKTVELAQSIGDARIKVVNDMQRKGQAERQNDIVELFNGDVLTLLNADVLPTDEDCLERLVEPFLQNPKIGIVSCRGANPKAKTFVEAVLNFSNNMKHDMTEHLNNGDNIYNCHGFARAFSRSCAKTIHWPAAVGEDAYSYFFAASKGFDFYYQTEAAILYRSPQTIKDHFKQSVRFGFSQDIMAKLFSGLDIKKYYKIPPTQFLKSTIKYFLKNPIYFTSYIMLQIAALFNPFRVSTTNTWEPSQSSKNLID